MRKTAPVAAPTTRTGPVGVGVIGAGMISDQYVGNLVKCPDVKVVVIGDIDPDRARAKAEQYGTEWGAPDDVLGHPDVELIINITIRSRTRRCRWRRSAPASTSGRRSR